MAQCWPVDTQMSEKFEAEVHPLVHNGDQLASQDGVFG